MLLVIWGDMGKKAEDLRVKTEVNSGAGHSLGPPPSTIFQ